MSGFGLENFSLKLSDALLVVAEFLPVVLFALANCFVAWCLLRKQRSKVEIGGFSILGIFVAYLTVLGDGGVASVFIPSLVALVGYGFQLYAKFRAPSERDFSREIRFSLEASSIAIFPFLFSVRYFTIIQG